ncbi:MAG: hypothetical protein ACP59X_18290 [Solidesulfovibrio sp. DCME]|uniref:hypothetical protein n=1 Tax=Solidesulfovibrio sp. DCME TaxID=3447380 RepID=UPI003D098312
MSKFEDSNLDNESASMNSIGATGGTGASGGMPSTDPLSPPPPPSTPAIGSLGEDDDPMRHMLMHFQGSTGAMGGTPEPDVQIEDGKPVPMETLARVAENTTGQIEKLSKEETLRQLKSQNVAAEGVFSSARSKMVSIGYIIGCLLVHLKSLVTAENENWGDYIEREFPEMKRRTREKCMNLANTPGILKHAYLGIDAAELVIQAIKPIKTMLSKEDPIGDLFERNGVVLNYDQIEKGSLTSLVKGVIMRQKLLQKELDINVQITSDYNKVVGAVTPVDIAVMLDRKEHGRSPEEYMKEVISKNGVRPNEVSDTQSSKQPIKYINAETVKLKSSIERLLEEKADLKKLDKTHLEALRAAVDTLLDRFSK